MTSMANSEMTSGTMDVCGVLCAAFSFFQLAIYCLKRKLEKANFSTYKSSFLVSEMRMALHLLSGQLCVDHWSINIRGDPGWRRRQQDRSAKFVPCWV